MEKFLLGAFAGGAAWGLLGALFFASAPTEIRIAIIMVLAGISAGAIGVFAVAMRVYAAFMLPMLLPLAITLSLESQAVQRCADGVRVQIRDHGPGIGAEFRPRMFQRFSQSDSSDTRRVGGTGLGLAISKYIVGRFGGRSNEH